MSSLKHCPTCGLELMPDRPEGFCPKCLLADGLKLLAQTPPPAATEAPAQTSASGTAVPGAKLQYFGDYELLEEISRGGMGVVFKARQISLSRLVAVKLISAGTLATLELVKRFKAEAEAAASLAHPNIVPIYEIGEHQGQHYFSMGLIEGPNLRSAISSFKLGPNPERAVRLATTVASAVHYAHQRGVLHRDIKPSNILLDAAGEPHLTDFGLAKLIEKESTLTRTNAVLGTPAYISPEQARGDTKEVTTAADVYGVGAVLYEMLTGSAPFAGGTSLETIRQVLEQEPRRPSACDPRIDRDLETICLKCLEKEPGKRYSSAAGLASDLERWLRHEPIMARRSSPRERLEKWVRRRPASAALGAAALLLLILVAIGSPIAAWRINRARQLAQARELQAHRAVYIANMNLAQQAWDQTKVGRVRQILQDTASSPSRDFEWYYWQSQTHLELKTLRGHLGPIGTVAFTPDGRFLTTSADSTAKIWLVESGRELFTLAGHTALIWSGAFSPDAHWVATASWDGTAKVWDAANGQLRHTLRGHNGGVWAVTFSPDSQRIVTGGDDGTAKVWLAATGQELQTLNPNYGINCVAFSPDGRRIVTGGDDAGGTVWEADSGRELFALHGHKGSIVSVAFPPDGRQIVTGSYDCTARVWDAVDGRPLFTLDGHRGDVNSVAFSPDGQRILTGSSDTTAKVWDAATGRELFTLHGHDDVVACVAFSADARQIATGSIDLTAKIWDAAGSRESMALTGHDGGVASVAFSPDAQRIVSGGRDQTVRVWDAATGRLLLSFPHHSGWVRSVAFSLNGREIATGSDDSTIKLWDAATGQELLKLDGHGRVWSVAFSPDGRRILAGGDDRTAHVWDTTSHRELLALKGHSGGIRTVACSPDGRRIITSSADRTAKVWDAATGQELLTMRGHRGAVWSAAFSLDGKWIVTGSEDQTARVWDAATARESLTLKGHTGGVRSAAFSRNGRRIITGSDDSTARVWDAESGGEVLTLKGNTEAVRSVDASFDGKRIVTGGADKSVRIWAAASESQVATWEREERTAAEDLAKLKSARVVSAESTRAVRAQDPGAIKNWLVLAPISFVGDGTTESVVRALDEEQIPGESHIRPRSGLRTKVGAVEMVWQAVDMTDYVLDFNQLLGEQLDASVAYAVCYIRSRSDQSGLVMKLGSDDLSKVYLNGQEVYRRDRPRGFVPDQDAIGDLQLKTGQNVVVFKVVNAAAGWQGSLRFTDAAGEPLKGIHVSLDPGPEDIR
jgi:WD40 repeat protein